jgi:hypothetical protein
MSCVAAAAPQLCRSTALTVRLNQVVGNEADTRRRSSMSITSKILMSALLVGFSVPAFAQGGAATTGSAPADSTQKLAPAQPHAGAPKTTGSMETTKPMSGKTSAVKPDTSKSVGGATGSAKPGTPATPEPGAPAVKSN